MTKRMPWFATVALFLAIATMPLHTAVAGLLVMPPRLIFKDGDRMKTLTVVNNSEDAALYRLTFYHQKQLPDGSYEILNETQTPGFDLSKMLVYSPRQVQLEPGGKQGVRMSLRRPENLPDGEYRVHVKVARYMSEEERKITKGQTAIVAINVAFAVPVILRKGRYDTTAKISDTKFIRAANDGKNKNPAKVEFMLNRQGKYSALGNVRIFWKDPSGNEKLVGILNKVNVFVENEQRSVSVNLNENVSGGTFRVRFEGDDIDKGILFDEVTFSG